MGMPRAGQLRQRITIQSRSATLDDYGHEVNTWSTVLADEPAKVEPISGNEKLRAMAASSQINQRVTVRYRSEYSDPTAMDAWRILFGSRIFNITSAQNLEERGRWLVMDCVEGSVNGQ